MRPTFPILVAMVGGCDAHHAPEHDLRTAHVCECVCLDPPCVCGVDSDGESGASSSDSSGGAPPSGPPTPTGVCPPLVDGTATFCPAGVGCWDVELRDMSEASQTGPLVLWWHGTTRTPLLDLNGSNSAVTAIRAQTGPIAIPWAAPERYTASPPHPWYGDGALLDHGIWSLADEVAGCFVAAGMADQDRLNVAGMSNGGIAASLFIEERDWAASVVSWSGGQPEPQQPTIPAGTETAYMAIHGGASDVYQCQPSEGCEPDPPGLFLFEPIATASAEDVASAGAFTLLCDHGSGHSTALGPEGAEFMADASRGLHPWDGYPFGSFQWSPVIATWWPVNQYCAEM